LLHFKIKKISRLGCGENLSVEAYDKQLKKKNLSMDGKYGGCFCNSLYDVLFWMKREYD